jgi:hypothetical protein
MKRKTLPRTALLLLGLVLGTGLAVAGELAPAAPQAPQPALAAPVCEVQPPVQTPALADAAQAPVAIDLFTPEPQTAAICPLIGCANDQYCRRDRDCTTAPGGVCNLFCPTKGCCAYPAP